MIGTFSYDLAELIDEKFMYLLGKCKILLKAFVFVVNVLHAIVIVE